MKKDSDTTDLGKDVDPETGNFIDQPGVLDYGTTDSELKLTPEAEEEIMGRVQDIQNFRGFIIRTQVPNLPKILTNGVKDLYELPEEEVPRWGTQGALIGKRRGSYNPGIYFSSVGYSGSFEAWKYIAWEEAGQVVLLLDTWKMLDKEIVEIIEEPDGPYENREDISSSVDCGTFRLEIEEEIEPEIIQGAIVSPEDCQLQRRANEIGHTTESITITSSRAKEILKGRLTKRMKGNPRAYSIPLYDNHGNLLWPRAMSYEKVKEFVAERNRQKKNLQENFEETAGNS